MGSEATWHLRGQSGLQETSNGNILRFTVNPNQQSPYMERNPQKMCIYEDLPHKEIPSSTRNKYWFYTTIKTQNPQKLRYA